MTKTAACLCIVTLALVTWTYTARPWLGKTLTSSEVKQRWGDINFDEQNFKKGDQSTRAKMAYSLMTSEKMNGLTISEIRNRLGDFDGHYFSESYPTYLIQTAKKPGDESWQIVFLIDKERKTKEVIVHKNCCN